MSQAASSTAAPLPGRARSAHLCVVTAAEVEFKAVAGLLTARSSASDGGVKICRGERARNQVTVLKAEIGAAGFADWLTSHLARTSYDALLVIGLAGGLDPKLKPGDAVIYDRCLAAPATPQGRDSKQKRDAREENASLACDPRLSNLLAEALQAAGGSCLRGAGLTIGRVVAEAENKLALGARSGAVAVDMETYEVLAVGARFGLPASALRVVLDEAGCDLPDFSRALRADGSFKAGRLIEVLLSRPLASARCFARLRPAIRALRRAAGLVLDLELVAE